MCPLSAAMSLLRTGPSFRLWRPSIHYLLGVGIRLLTHPSPRAIVARPDAHGVSEIGYEKVLDSVVPSISVIPKRPRRKGGQSEPVGMSHRKATR